MAKNMKRSRKLEGYSLIEISIVLLIIGIITSAMLKGKDLIDSAKLDSVVNDVRSLQLAYTQYVQTFAEKPDNDLFKKLNDAGLIDSESFKKPKIGGEYKIIKQENNNVTLQITNLNKKQAQLLRTKAMSAFDNNTAIEIKNDNIVEIHLD